MGRWNKDRVVSTVKVLKNMSQRVLDIVVNNVNNIERTFVTTWGALDYPAGRSEFFPSGANLRVQ